jgi:HSP90 family molecular chaperone
MAEPQLTMTFDPNTIEHLGVRMYSTLPPVLSELIANCYDADAKRVILTLIDRNGEKKIIIEDDGLGMSFKDIDDKFLHIGRNRRAEEGTQTTPGGRNLIGKKGLGKLSFFGIAHEIEIFTKKDGKENAFKMSWEAIKRENREYHPEITKTDEDCSTEEHGTTIVLTDIQRESDFDPEALANSLSKIFIIEIGRAHV